MGEVIETLSLPRKYVPDGAYAGRRVEGVEARGKNLLVHVEGGVTLRVHLKMNGRVTIGPRVPLRPDPSVVFALSTREHLVVGRDAPIAELVRTRDLARTPDAQVRSGLGGLGPDLLAAGFVPDEAAARWHQSRHATIAEALLDQGLAAGIGNEWKSELLFVVGIDPFRSPSDVPLATLVELAAQAATRMRRSVEARPALYPIDRRRGGRLARTARGPDRASPEGLAVGVYERGGEPCYRCGQRVEMKRHGQPPRSTYFCPGCQK